MSTDLECFRATTEHRTPGRVLYTAGFTPDLQQRVLEHVGGDNIARHYGFYQRVSLPIRRPKEAPELDYSPPPRC